MRLPGPPSSFAGGPCWVWRLSLFLVVLAIAAPSACNEDGFCLPSDGYPNGKIIFQGGAVAPR